MPFSYVNATFNASNGNKFWLHISAESLKRLKTPLKVQVRSEGRASIRFFVCLFGKHAVLFLRPIFFETASWSSWRLYSAEFRSSFGFPRSSDSFLSGFLPMIDKF